MRQRRSAAVRRRVHEKALVEVRGCLRDWDDDRDAAREAKAVIDTLIAPEYQGRALIELLQNAHDAHPAGAADGRVEIRLDEEEGEYGTLYVANQGKPFSSKNFKDLCSIALSRKRADAGIGHKGVGFKSVLNLCGAPEVYSVDREGSRIPDGLTFRFARLDDYDALAREVAPERADFPDYLKANLHTLKVPVFLKEAPKTIHNFTRRGFVTVVRLPLKSADACSAAAAQVRELMDDSAPFELFLDRLERVQLEWRAAGENRRRTYDRQVQMLHQARGLKVQQVTLRRRMRLIVICGKADPDRAREALTASIEKNGMRHDWMAWEKKAEVRVAVPVGDPLDKGRLYTFLPMGEQIAAPLRGFVHAPFFAEMNRRSFNAGVPWNDLLLDTVAKTCARAVLATTDGRAPIPSGALVDLMCWQSPKALPRLTTAFQQLGHGITQVPFIPTIAAASGTRTSLHQAVLWEGKEPATAFTPHAVAATGITDLLDPQLHPVRLRELVSLAGSMGTRLEPPTERLASWAERLAEATARAPFDPGWWADFYYDLSQEFPDGWDVAGEADHPHGRAGCWHRPPRKASSSTGSPHGGPLFRPCPPDCRAGCTSCTRPSPGPAKAASAERRAAPGSRQSASSTTTAPTKCSRSWPRPCARTEREKTTTTCAWPASATPACCPTPWRGRDASLRDCMVSGSRHGAAGRRRALPCSGRGGRESTPQSMTP